MPPDSIPAGLRSEAMLRRLLGSMSAFTLVMSVPQVLAIWMSRQAAGVSVLSWAAYLASALLWFWYGLRKPDRNIYLPCIGWIAVDAAVIAGALAYGQDSATCRPCPPGRSRRAARAGKPSGAGPWARRRILRPSCCHPWAAERSMFPRPVGLRGP